MQDTAKEVAEITSLLHTNPWDIPQTNAGLMDYVPWIIGEGK